MASKKKLLQAAAGSAGGGTTDIPEVFSTYLYDGTGSAQTITNGIDLSGEGGLVWIKERTNVSNHGLFDTERGVTKYIHSDGTDAEQTGATTLTAFNSNGFSIGSGFVNDNNRDFCSWTFRKAPNFFNVVTYTGNTVGNSAQTISHGLGSTPGLIIVKRYSTADNWIVWHRSITNGFAALNDTGAWLTNNYTSFITSVGSTSFTVGESLNTNGASFVAYVFAHNDGDGGFGPDGDQDVVKCGSYTGNNSTNGPIINLGFEPQWLLIRHTANAGNSWHIFDSMRGVITGEADAFLAPNTDGDEQTTADKVEFNSTGFQIKRADGDVNANGNTYIYMAIRRGPLAVPEDATKVFSVNKSGTGDSPTNSWPIGFNADMIINAQYTGISSRYHLARLTGRQFNFTNSTAVEQSASASSKLFFSSDGIVDLNTSFWGAASGIINWSWKRAPGYFDVVGYVGAGAAQTVNHNLGVVPEMMWIKNRDSAENWAVYHSALGTSKYLHLNTTDAALTTDAANRWNNTSPTATQFSVGTSTEVSHFTRDFIAYLFATVAGVSKVGSYTGSNSSAVTVDCGFSNGARFVLIKSVDGAGNWYVWDSLRGINSSADDAQLFLNTTDAETNNSNNIDPHSSGFTVTQQGNSPISQNGETYIFYAIA